MPVSSRFALWSGFPAPSLSLSGGLGAALLMMSLCCAVLIKGGQPTNDTSASGSSPQASAPSTKANPPRALSKRDVAEPSPVLHFLRLPPEDAYLKNAAIPDSKIVDSPARPFYLATAAPMDGGVSAHCLAQAVYYEAASESLAGQRAVAQVVLNRVRDRRFPKTVCGVVFEGSGLRTGCQFSFTCDGSLSRPPLAAAWRRAQTIAEAALEGDVMQAIGHATHYHTVWVTPYWGAGLTKWGRLGAHIFYRWAGGGAPVAIGLHPAGENAPQHFDVAVTGAAELDKAASPAVVTAAVPAGTYMTAASVPPATWPAPLGTFAGQTLPTTPGSVSDAPYQSAHPRGDLNGPHFAARDHR